MSKKPVVAVLVGVAVTAGSLVLLGAASDGFRARLQGAEWDVVAKGPFRALESLVGGLLIGLIAGLITAKQVGLPSVLLGSFQHAVKEMAIAAIIAVVGLFVCGMLGWCKSIC